MLIYFSVVKRDINKEDFLKANFDFGKFLLVSSIHQLEPKVIFNPFNT